MQLSDSEFMSAKEKELVLRSWEIFLKHGCQRKHFTERLYDHLTSNCDFIAHYNTDGFYAHYFSDGDSTALFLSQFDERKGVFGDIRSIEYLSYSWLTHEYSDINRAMIQVAAKYIPALIEKAKESQKQADIAQATALLKKHNLA